MNRFNIQFVHRIVSGALVWVAERPVKVRLGACLAGAVVACGLITAAPATATPKPIPSRPEVTAMNKNPLIQETIHVYVKAYDTKGVPTGTVLHLAAPGHYRKDAAMPASKSQGKFVGIIPSQKGETFSVTATAPGYKSAYKALKCSPGHTQVVHLTLYR